MAILIRCPACNKGFRVRDELAGTTVHCSACDESIAIPAQDGEKDEAPRGKSGGSALVLVLVLVAGALFLVCGGAGVGGFLLFRKRTPPVTTVTVDGKEVKLDTRDLGKDLDKVLDPNKAKTLPEHTVRPQLVPVSGKVSDVYDPRARRNLVLLRTGAWLNPFAKPDDPGVRIDRLDVRAGKSLGSVEVKLSGVQGVHDVSADGALLALNRPGIGLEVDVVSLLDGKVLARNWKPVFRHTDEGGKTRSLAGRGLRFLAANRWLVVYEGDAVELFSSTGSDWQRVTLRGPSAPRKRGFGFGQASAGWCVRNDGKTLALWKGQGFDLIDTATGAVRRTGELATQGDEKTLEAKTVLFSPDGTRLLARVEAARGAGVRSFMARWDLGGSDPPVRLETEPTQAGFFWWGGGHFVQLGNRKFGYSATVHDAATGKALADLAHRGQALVLISPDGKLRFLTRRPGEEGEGFLFQAPFPTRLLAELQKRAATGKLPTLQASSDGLGIRP
jgi:hypothetical protein